MPTPEAIIPLMEGMVGTMANEAARQNVAHWVESCKRIMRLPEHRALTDWNFLCIPDIDETAAAGPSVTAPESGARLHGMLIGYSNATTTDEAYVAVCDDADGAIAAFAAGDTRVTDAPQVMVKLTAVATEGTEEYLDFTSAKGFSFASYMAFAADGEDGTNPAADDIRAWILYRTTP